MSGPEQPPRVTISVRVIIGKPHHSAVEGEGGGRGFWTILAHVHNGIFEKFNVGVRFCHDLVVIARYAKSMFYIVNHVSKQTQTLKLTWCVLDRLTTERKLHISRGMK